MSRHAFVNADRANGSLPVTNPKERAAYQILEWRAPLLRKLRRRRNKTSSSHYYPQQSKSIMLFFRKPSRSSSDKGAGAKTKNQKDPNKKNRKGGFLRKKKTPLIHCDDASRASSTQPQPRWNKIET